MYNYESYWQKALKYKPAAVATTAEYLQQLGMKIGNNTLTELD